VCVTLALRSIWKGYLKLSLCVVALDRKRFHGRCMLAMICLGRSKLAVLLLRRKRSVLIDARPLRK
jgi:hypothetical protein